MKKTILIIVITLLTIPCLSAQNINNVFSPFGFQAPFLQGGEYILNARGYYNWSENDYSYEDGSSAYSYGESSNMYAYVRGLLALTDKVLVNTGLYFYPEWETGHQYSGSSTYDQEYWYTRTTYINPFFTLIFRPIKNLEISGYYSTYNNKQGYDRITDDVETHVNDNDYKYSYANVSINYFGKLWGK